MSRMRTMTLEEYTAGLAERKAACGYVGLDYVSPNGGGARTSEKRGLLQQLKQLTNYRFNANL